MQRICFVHFGTKDADAWREKLTTAGFAVEVHSGYTTEAMRQWRSDPPHAFAIDLTRLPSHGREVAIALRQSPKTRPVPIVFLNGAIAKVDALRAVLPDARYCVSSSLLAELRAVVPVAAGSEAGAENGASRHAGVNERLARRDQARSRIV